MKKLFLLLTLSVFSINAFAQSNDFLWAKQIGGTCSVNCAEEESINSIAKDASGNVYITGFYNGTVDCDPGPNVFNLVSSGYQDVFICKYNSNGNLIWAKSVGGTSTEIGNAIKIDNNENVLITGYFNAIADFDPGVGIFNLSTSPYQNIFVLKLDSNGNFIWVKQLGLNGGGFTEGKAIDIDQSGNIYTTGSFSGTADFDPSVSNSYNLISSGNLDIFISKLDASGNFVWAKQIGGTNNDAASSIKVDISGNIITSGYFQNSVDFDPGIGVYNLTSGVAQTFISKLDNDGIFIWAKQFSGGTSSCRANSVCLDILGGVYLTGYFDGAVDFDPGIGVYELTTNPTSVDVYISKLDASGNFVWAKQFAGSAGSSNGGISIASDNFGNCYITGEFGAPSVGTVDFNPGIGVYNLTSTSNFNVFISKLDVSGNFLWAKQIGGNATYPNTYQGTSILISDFGDVYTTGIFATTADFNTEAGTYNMTSVGGNDMFIHKLSPCGPATISSTSIIICGNTTIDLTATSGSSYQWYKNNILIGGANSQVYSANASGSYSCVVGLSCGTNTSNAIQIAKYNLPTITLTTSGPTTFCNGDSVIISASSNAGANATWQWYKDNVVISGATNNSYKATIAGTYKCVVTNSSTTCSRISTGVVVSILTTTASVTAGSSTTFCIGGNVLLTAISNAGAGSTYQWYLNSNIIGGATNTTYTASTSGNYSFTVNNSNGCNATSAATPVTVNPLPVVTITPSGSTVICPSGTLSLTASAGTSYLWSTAATTQTIVVSTAGNYSVTVTNANGCSASSAPTSVSLNACETPTSIAVTNITGTKATISWTGNSCAVKYRVRIRVLGTTTWTTIIINSPTQTKTITGLQPLTTYEYQVRTDCNSAGTSYSAYSTIQTFTTICDCTKPTNISVSNVTQNGATVSWLGNSCAVKYRLQYRVQGTTAWTTKTITAPTLFYNIVGLTNNTIYEYHLRSDCNSTGTVNSGWTTTATITTPLRLEVSEISSSTFYVSPNPCSTCFVNGTMDEQDLSVTDIVGRKINVQFTKSENGFYINLSENDKGIFLIRNIKTGEVVKFVKE